MVLIFVLRLDVAQASSLRMLLLVSGFAGKDACATSNPTRSGLVGLSASPTGASEPMAERSAAKYASV